MIFHRWTCHNVYAIAVLAYLFTTHVNGESVRKQIPFDRGTENSWAWLLLTILSGLGIFFNILSMDLFLSLSDSTKVSFYALNVALNLIDLIFVVFFFIKSTVSYVTKSFYGGFEQESMCLLDTVMNGTFVIWSAFTIVGISHLARIYLCYGRKLTNNQIILWVIGSGLYGVTVSLGLVYNPFGGYGLVSSGTYCFIDRTKINIPVGFFFALIVPFTTLAYNLYHIHKAITASQRLLEAQNMVGQAKGHYTLMVKKLGYFLLSICICEMPTLVNYSIELFSGQNVEPDIAAIAGIFGFSNSSLINPILFIVLNIDIQEKLKEKYITKITLAYTAFTHFIMRKYKTVLPENAGMSTKVSEPSVSVWNFDYESWELWATDELLKKAFHEYGKKEYVMENFSFYDDIRKFHDMHDNKGKLRYEHGELVNARGEDFIAFWNEVNTFVNRLYVIYIKVGKFYLFCSLPHQLDSCVIGSNSSIRDKYQHRHQKPFVSHLDEALAGSSEYWINKAIHTLNEFSKISGSTSLRRISPFTIIT
jgi:hypothetical protein